MNCPNCGEPSSTPHRYCTNCGAHLPRQCPSCGAANPPAAKFCGDCGSRFTVAEPLVGVSDSEAERRQLTVMFCDLVDSTGLASRVDPEEFAGVIRMFRGACGDVVTDHSGVIAQFLGDGFVAYFGSPHAHEDDAEQAIQTGLDIVEVVRGLEVGERAHVRVGIATGLVVVGDAAGGGVPEASVLGDTPHRAARLQTEAAPDTVVVGAVTKRLAGGMFTYENLGERRLKGFPTLATVWRVVGPGQAESRFAALHGGALMPLIRRTSEADTLRQLWTSACSGQGQTILIGGEPGIGKSRLTQILRQAQRRTDGAALRYYRCPMHQSGALQPVIGQLRRAAGMSNADSDGMRYKKLKTLLGPAADKAMPVLATLLSLPTDGQQSLPTDSAQRVKEVTLDVLVELVVDRAESGPVLVICEDIHWIDPATLEYVDRLVARSRDAQLIVVITFRSEFAPPWPDAPHMTRLNLERLTPMDTAALAHEVAGRRELPTEVLRQIIDRTDGVPLFVEELTQMILDAGYLKEEEKGVLRLRAPLPATSVPETLHDLLMARLDRPAPMKEVAQIAATMGRSFSLELLVAATDLGREALIEALADLEKAGLIFRRAEAPEPLFEFKHALVREAAYQSLLRSTRRRIHERVAVALVDRFPSICASEPERVAHHFTNARRPTDAVKYWLKAGQRASQRSANTLAADYLDQAMRLLPQIGDRVARTSLELTILSAQGPILMASKGYAASEVEAVFARARTLCRHGGEAMTQFRALRGLFLFHLTRGEIIQATELAGEMSRHARRTGDEMSRFEADRIFGTCLFFKGQFVETRSYMQRVVEAYSREQHGHLAVALAQDPGTSGRIYLGWSEWYLGYPAWACALLDDAIRLSRELHHPHTQAAALLFAAMLRVSRREPAAAKALADECIDLCREQRFPFWMATAGVVSDWAAALQGDAEDGVERIRDELAKWQQTGARLGVPMYLGMLAEALDRAGRADESMAPLNDALAMAERNGERFWVAELYRLRGQALLSSGAEAAAEDSFCKALETARSQCARSMELRAAIGLARVWERKGMRPAARELLANVRKPFTEGFDCPDLVDCEALLGQLAAADASASKPIFSR